jgi:hypothetical protein
LAWRWSLTGKQLLIGGVFYAVFLGLIVARVTGVW